MFKFKPKKVFEKINKMNRKQAYTIGAVVVVLVVALILVVSSIATEDDSFAGFNERGYDLAQMPFATDEAEKYLLANAYPDMEGNGSSLLYSLQEKEERQELELTDFEDDEEENEYDSGSDYNYSSDKDSSLSDSSSYSDSYNDYGSSRGGGRGYGGGRGSRSPTQINQMSNSSMARAGGGGVDSSWNPGDSSQFKNTGDRGRDNSPKPQPEKKKDGREALSHFRAGTIAAARINENKMKNAGASRAGGDVMGSDAFKKDGTVDLDKLKEGGFTLDTSAPSHSTDLNNLDKKVSDAVKNAENKDKNDKKNSFWTDLWQGLVKGLANKLIDIGMNGIQNAIVGARQSFLDGRAFDKSQVTTYKNLDPQFREEYKAGYLESHPKATDDDVADSWNRLPAEQKESTARSSATHQAVRNGTFSESAGNWTQIGEKNGDNDDNDAKIENPCSDGQTLKKNDDGNGYHCE